MVIDISTQCPDSFKESRVGIQSCMSLDLAYSPDIDVYDTKTLVHRRRIRVEGLLDGSDIVAHLNVLYVSDS